MPWLRLLGTLPACLALSLPAQQAAPPAPSPHQPANQSPRLIPRTGADRELRYQADHSVVLNVRVADASGKPATELKQADFTLLDDQQRRNIVSFRSVEGGSATAPVHIVLVLDTVNNPTRRLGYFRKEIEKYLKQDEGILPYPISIVLFSDSGTATGRPSRDRDALLAELRNLGDLHQTGCTVHPDRGNSALADLPGSTGKFPEIDPTGPLNCLNQRFILSISALNRLALRLMNVPGRVILIWMGPGWPLLSDPHFSPDTPAVKRSFFDNFVQVSTALREAQVTLDAISSPDSFPDDEPRNMLGNASLNGVPDESQATAASLALQAIANQSGGQVLADARDIAGEIAACVADAASYYVLSFVSPPAAGYGEYHSLQVKVDKPELKVRTNTLYYAEQ